NHRTESQDDDVAEQVTRASDDPRVFQSAKVFLNGTQTRRSSQAILRLASERPENRRSVHLSESSSRRQLRQSLRRSPWGVRRCFPPPLFPLGLREGHMECGSAWLCCFGFSCFSFCPLWSAAVALPLPLLFLLFFLCLLWR